MCDETPIRQCAKCGMIGMRNKQTRSLEEVEKYTRDCGEPPLSVNGSNTYDYEIFPVCVAGAIDFESEAREIGGDEWNENVAKCCNVDRRCGDFMQWKIGLSPKEHLEMGFLADERAKSQAWLDRQKVSNDALHREIAEKSQMTSYRCALIGIVAALVGTVAGAFISAAIAYWIIPSNPSPVQSPSPVSVLSPTLIYQADAGTPIGPASNR